MGKKLLIDATHAEETRVVVLDGNKVEEFDFETIHKRQLAGNIYLAKVTRVEPSLQAAFVDYGGNRHGFLAFAEIHPDYYQIPVADRKALLEEERAMARDQDDEGNRRSSRRRRGDDKPAKGEANADATTEDQADDQPVADAQQEGPSEATVESAAVVTQAPVVEETPVAEPAAVDTPAAETPAAEAEPETPAEPKAPMAAQAEGTELRTYGAMDIVELEEEADGDDEDHSDDDDEKPFRAADNASDRDDQIESVADEDVSDEVRPQRRSRARRYKIQEVIKVRQIMLVQVVKEERGNKGAALTTYLSLAGRYCVLMPNTARGGGISRKITNAADRKKLKEIAGEFDVPEGAGLIIRTAGANRTKPEIKRDYEYLFRVWEQIRDLTLRSIAPAPIYEEGNLIKRSIRDLYNKDIDEVLVEGEAGYRTAQDFMQMIMPSHAKSVVHYQEAMPLFARFQVESYLAAMFNPTVQLKSGGYIVIGVTEALVAIDVNSGKSTREGSIEDTALKTNLEASDEVARQLRLRDLAGLIVIDFIDMEERKNNAAVEKRLKDALRSDRARIQVGRISGFGLMEMSRQRLRPGMIEATTQPCPHCHGTGLIRSDNSLALQILRALEEEGTRNRSKEVLVKAPYGIVNYLFNAKREHLAQIELRYGMAIRIEGDASLVSPDYSIEKFKTATRIVSVPSTPVVSLDALTMSSVDDAMADYVEDEIEAEGEAETVAEARDDATDESGDARGDGDGSKRKRRRRRRRRGGQNGESTGDDESNGDDESGNAEGADAAGDEPVAAEAPTETVEAAPAEAEAPAEPEKPVRKRRSRARKPKVDEAEGETAAETVAEAPAAEAAPADATAEGETAAPRKRTRTRRKPKAETEAAEAVTAAAATDAPVETPVETPVEAPGETPVEAPVEAPAEAPVEAPVEVPAQAPVEAPATTVVEVPVVEAPAAEVAVEAPVAKGADAEPKPAEVTEEPATDPARPRRAGWWARKS
ncbi:Rne/Rng family ribonuclease [Pararhodobacter zhoushanensis]|uniref:Rne/Rng family ribonuclease n=1 Tax=Pararhodobacter zhoushanensis TaxID=2479545 RepID=UPI000F8F6A71|nr:ribonuclease E/G [Pararhodobacter zhoushanensis]